MVRGLSAEYDTIGTIVNQSGHSWNDARKMIEVEQQRINARTKHTQDSVLLSHTPQTTTQTNPNAPQSSPYPNEYKGKNYDPAKASRDGGQQERNNRPHTPGIEKWRPNNPAHPHPWKQPNTPPNPLYNPRPTYNNYYHHCPPPMPYPAHLYAAQPYRPLPT